MGPYIGSCYVELTASDSEAAPAEAPAAEPATEAAPAEAPAAEAEAPTEEQQEEKVSRKAFTPKAVVLIPASEG